MMKVDPHGLLLSQIDFQNVQLAAVKAIGSLLQCLSVHCSLYSFLSLPTTEQEHANEQEHEIRHRLWHALSTQQDVGSCVSTVGCLSDRLAFRLAAVAADTYALCPVAQLQG